MVAPGTTPITQCSVSTKQLFKIVLIFVEERWSSYSLFVYCQRRDCEVAASGQGYLQTASV